MNRASRFTAMSRRPVVAVVFGACAAVALQTAYTAAARWWSARSALVVVDGEVITRRDLERELAHRGLGADRLAGAGRAVLEDMVDLEVLAANARRAGYAEDDDVRRDIKHALAGRFRKERIERELRAVDVDEEAVEAYYQEHLDRFTLPEAARAAIIFFAVPSSASEDRRQEIAAKAEGVRQEALGQTGGSDFGPLAVRHSDDQASRYRGGDVGWLSKGQQDSRHEPALLETIFALQQPGEIAPLVSTPSGVFLVKLIEKRPPRVQPLAKVFEEIRQRLLRARRAERERQLYGRATAQVAVHRHEDRIAALGLEAAESAQRAERAPAPWADAR